MHHDPPHYLPCGSHYLQGDSHYLPWVGLSGHCSHCAGFIFHFWACVIIAWAGRQLRGRCTGLFESLSAVRHAVLHHLSCGCNYLPRGSHYLPWVGLGSHCGHCAGIICDPQEYLVIVFLFWLFRGHAQAHLCHYLPCAMLGCIICRAAATICHAAAIICCGRAWAVIVVIVLALSAILGHKWSLRGHIHH